MAIPRIFRKPRKRTNALTNRPELLGDCHDQCAHWSRNDSSNERSNNNLSFCNSISQNDSKSVNEIENFFFGHKKTCGPGGPQVG